MATTQGLFSNLGDTLNNMPLSGSLGLLTTGVGLLEGQNIGQAVQSGLGAYQGLADIEERRKRKGLIDKLVAEGGFSKQEQALIAASQNPAAVAAQIRSANQSRADAAAARAASRKPTLQEQIEERLAAGQGQGLAGEALQRFALTGNVPSASAPKTIVFGDKLLAIGQGGSVTQLMENDDPSWRTLQGDEIDVAKKSLNLEGQPTLGLFSVKGEGKSAEYRFTPLRPSGDTNIQVSTGDNNGSQGIPNTDAVADLNKKYSADLLKWVQNDNADSQKLILQLETVSKALSDGETNLSGPILNLIPDALKAFTEGGQKAINTREAVEEVVQRNLKLILGGQFTEREGEKLVKRAFNPALDESENLIRVNRLLAQMKAAAAAKQAMADHFTSNGTLAGFDQTKIPTINDFNLLLDTLDEQQQDTGVQLESGPSSSIAAMPFSDLINVDISKLSGAELDVIMKRFSEGK